MSKNAVGDSLFGTIARDRPEWVAQGLFAHALASDSGVRAFVSRRLFPSDWKKLKGEIPEVDRERSHGRWRADVVATWGKERWWFELKLASGLTYRQAQELGRKPRAALVYPRGRRPKGVERLIGFTWDELAREATDPTLGELLGQVNATSSWWQSKLTKDVLQEEFASFLKAGAWEHLYRFLSTVDALLRESWGSDYRPSHGWAQSKTGEAPYYGFAFRMRGQRSGRYFLSFSADENGPKLSLDHYANGSWTSVLKRTPPPYGAQAAAKRVRRAVEATRRVGK